jgi:nitrogenase molybdenum-iron protein alpha/beta subunit
MGHYKRNVRALLKKNVISPPDIGVNLKDLRHLPCALQNLICCYETQNPCLEMKCRVKKPWLRGLPRLCL